MEGDLVPEFEKLLPLLGGGGASSALLFAAYWFLRRQESGLSASQARVDHFGDEMYKRWEVSDRLLNRYRMAYTALFHDAPPAVQDSHPKPEDLEKV